MFPGTETPSDHEMETAYSLLLMNTQGPKSTNTNSGQLELQEPSVEPRAAHCEEVNPNLPDLTGMLSSLPSDHTTDKFRDAMEHIVGHVLSSTMPKPLNVPDAVDSLCAKSVLVETADAKNMEYVLVKPQTEKEIKPCSIRLTRIDLVLSYVPKQNLCQALMHAGRPHTCSMVHQNHQNGADVKGPQLAP